jgi:hypothetical protein
MIIDQGLLKFATAAQAAALKAASENMSYAAAAKTLGVHKDGVRKHIKALEERAAKQGYAPGHWESGVAPGYMMGKVTIQRRQEDGTFRWERQHPDLETLTAALEAAVEAAKEDIPAAKAVKAPKLVREDLCTQYTVTDYHIGMQAHACEGDNVGADWNFDIAEDLLVRAVDDLATKSPDSGTAVLALLGDLMHFDGPDPVTPTHKHPLDSAGRQRTMIRTVVRTIRRVVLRLLIKHRRLIIVVAEGNHDLAGTPWLQEVLLAMYENEPRVEIIDNDLPYYAFEFGKVMLGFSHGHTKKKESFPLLFATMFREIWGRVRKVYIHCGHQHHVDEKEYNGAKVIQHPTMAAPDSHANRGGWISEREMSAIHYHAEFGQIGRTTTTPEMLEAA